MNSLLFHFVFYNLWRDISKIYYVKRNLSMDQNQPSEYLNLKDLVLAVQ